MNSADIKRELNAAVKAHSETDQRAATLALLAVATIARDVSPAAAYVLVAETDQNDSGELWVQSVCDVEHNEIADSAEFDSDTIAYHMHAGNKGVWLPFMTTMTEAGKSHLGEYLLDVEQVLRGISGRPDPTVFRMLDMSIAHLPPEMRDDLNQRDGVIADERSYGWLLWVPEDIDQHVADNDDGGSFGRSVPPEIIRIYRKAAAHDCQYVLLDQDASVVSDLPTYGD